MRPKTVVNVAGVVRAGVARIEQKDYGAAGSQLVPGGASHRVATTRPEGGVGSFSGYSQKSQSLTKASAETWTE